VSSFWTITFLAVLGGLTLIALWKWYTTRGTEVEEAERRVFARFVFGLMVFWLFAAAMYFGAPLLSSLR
jgi:hypothetical protein